MSIWDGAIKIKSLKNGKALHSRGQEHLPDDELLLVQIHISAAKQLHESLKVRQVARLDMLGEHYMRIC